MKKKFLILTAAFLLLVTAKAQASLEPFFTFTGDGANISVDAVAMGNFATNTVQAEIAANATIEAAFLYSASVWTGGLSNVVFNGVTQVSNAASRLDVGSKAANPASENRWDVTSIVASVYDGVGGIYNFNVSEQGSLDGEILAVVYSVAGDTVQTALIFDGESALAGDTFGINLATPYDGTTDAIFSLGISFGFQPGGQVSIVDVNGSRLTSSAGGQDDGFSANGGLITAGGVGDSTANPAPFASATSFRTDDELYNLASFMTVGDTLITINTRNPSFDDNIFYASLVVNGLASTEPLPGPIPEPGTVILMGIGLAGLVGVAARRRRKKTGIIASK